MSWQTRPAIKASQAVKHAGQPNSFPKKTIIDHFEEDNFSDKKSGKNLSG